MEPLRATEAARTPEILPYEEWVEKGHPSGVYPSVGGEEDLSGRYEDLLAASGVLIVFAAFMDGRAFTHARQLRDLGYRGTLLAGGDVLPDQWAYLHRVGFDAFLEADKNEIATQLPGFSEAYQADAQQRIPMFRRLRR